MSVEAVDGATVIIDIELDKWPSIYTLHPPGIRLLIRR